MKNSGQPSSVGAIGSDRRGGGGAAPLMAMKRAYHAPARRRIDSAELNGGPHHPSFDSAELNGGPHHPSFDPAELNGGPHHPRIDPAELNGGRFRYKIDSAEPKGRPQRPPFDSAESIRPRRRAPAAWRAPPRLVLKAAPMTELVALDPHLFGPDQPCFGCSPEHPIGFRLRFFLERESVVTRFTPEARYQGPPGVMHGGLVTTLADEIAAWTVIGLRRRFGFTAAIEARLKKPVRIGEEVVGRGRITSDTPRIVKIQVELSQAALQCFAGEFTFALLDRAAAERLLGKALPEGWEPFAR